MDTHATCMGVVMGNAHRSGFLLPAGMVMHNAIQDSRAFLVRRISGNWLLSIHPHTQSIFGWLAANHGYPRIAF